VSNNAVTGGALVPLLTLGIPGDPVTAVLIGALLIQGREAGPFFIPQHPEQFYAILLLFLSNMLLLTLGLAGSGLAARILKIPHGVMVPVIFVAAAAAGVFHRLEPVLPETGADLWPARLSDGALRFPHGACGSGHRAGAYPGTEPAQRADRQRHGPDRVLHPPGQRCEAGVHGAFALGLVQAPPRGDSGASG
jgi:hypothetical protein